MAILAAAGAAVGSWFATIGAGSAVVAAAAAATEAAIIGAAVGFATSVISGTDPLEGALKGAGLGAVTGGVMGGVSAAVGEGAAVAGEAATASEAATAAETGFTSNFAGQAVKSNPSALVGTTNAAQAGTQAATQAGTQAAGKKGLLSNVFGDNTREILGKAAASSGTALLDDRTRRHELDVLIEENRLNRDAQKIKGLENVKSPILPSIKTNWGQTPDWRMS